MSRGAEVSLPQIDVSDFHAGTYYEVVDQSGQTLAPPRPIQIFNIEIIRDGEDLDYKRTKQADYESFKAGIDVNKRDERRASRIKNLSFAGAAISGTLVVAETYNTVFNPDASSTNETGWRYLGEVFPTFILIMGALLAKDARTRARNRRQALNGASQSGHKRFISPFDPKK